MPITLLPPEVASQIAAGEVVERPASVVKELLENAIDAGATQVDITIEGAGRTLIEVADNGQGIASSELSLAVERHATSKLATAADLLRISSLGFRGEALASIGSVARLMITSAPAGSEMAARIRVDGGRASPVEAAGAPQGTLVRVENLFFNVPARLKFLKTDRTERKRITELTARYAVAYPGIRFHLRQEGKPALQTSGSGDRREVLAYLYGADIARRMLSLDASYDAFRATGFISPPDVTRSNRRGITLFINGRWVQDAGLTAALVQAYHTLTMVGRSPIAILFIELPPESVDINVHPAKSEIRLQDPSKVFTDIRRSVRRALLAHAPVPGIAGSPEPKWAAPASASSGGKPLWSGSGGPGIGGRGTGRTGNLPHTLPRESDIPAQPEMPQAGRMPLLRLVGQIASAFLVAEGPDGLYLVDQHAAHERVLFEKFMAQRQDEIPAQTLLAPETVELPPEQSALIEDQIPLLNKLGFEVTRFGPNTFQIRAVPSLLAGMSASGALRVLVDDFEEDERPLQAEIEARIIARVCKRAAVKAGKTLSTEEQHALLRDLEACAAPRTCPHGRPTMIHLSVDLLERQFGRRGAR